MKYRDTLQVNAMCIKMNYNIIRNTMILLWRKKYECIFICDFSFLQSGYSPDL